MASFSRYGISPQWFTIVPSSSALRHYSKPLWVYPVPPQSPWINLYIHWVIYVCIYVQDSVLHIIIFNQHENIHHYV